MASGRHIWGIPPHGEAGAISILAALCIVMIFALVGFAVDTGRAVVLRNELQASADACALAAALELNGGVDATARASSAGSYLASRNRQSFQSVAANISGDGIRFASLPDGPFVTASAISSGDAQYVRCTGELKSVAAFLLSAVGIATFDVKAVATAGSLPSQATCSLPMALCARASGANFGYTRGASAEFGEFVWAFVADTSVLSGLGDLRTAFTTYGACNASTQAGRCLATLNGDTTTIMEEWNTRFGVYKQGGTAFGPITAAPDLTGHGYASPLPAGGVFPDYGTTKAPNRTPFTGNVPAYNVDQNVNRLYGASYRRLAIMPVVQCGSSACGTGSQPIVGWACVLLLSPVKANENPTIEYIANASSDTSPCRAPGTPGGPASIGPRVPTLVN